MESTLSRRFTDDSQPNIECSAHLQNLLRHIAKRKSEKSTPHRIFDNDSGVECNTDAEKGGKIAKFDVSTSDISPSQEHDADQSNQDASAQESVPIIGGHEFDKTKKVVAALPKWLAQPIIISTDLSNLRVKVKKFKFLDELLVRNLKANGVKYLFPVQAEVIPWLLQKQCRENLLIRHSAPRDLCVSAPTGSGKTLTYVLPIIQSLKDRFIPTIRALVVVPVQELALQIHEVFKVYCKGTNLKVEVTTGGKTDLSKEQANLVRKVAGGGFESKIDVLITTPGRLVEHLNYTEGFDVTNLRFLVIDEADRVMENVQDNWMHILEKRSSCCSKTSSIVSVGTIKERKAPQKLLFSATLSHDPEKLKQLGLFQPVLFTSVANDVGTTSPSEEYVGKYTTPRELEEFYSVAPTKLKPLVLCSLVERGWDKILCFAKSIEDAHKLSQLLGLLMPKKTVKELSSKLTRKDRDDTLKDFSDGKVDILVCSDVIARGLDIPGVKYVVSYDPPKHVEGYIHRVGRTGRAGSQGSALSLLDPDGQKDAFLQKLVNVNKQDVQEMILPEDEYLDKLEQYKKALATLKTVVSLETNVQNESLKNLKRKPQKTSSKQKTEVKFESNVQKKSLKRKKKNKKRAELRKLKKTQ